MTEGEVFARFLEALGPTRAEVVIVGGWAQRLLGLHPLVSRPGPALATNDVDVLFKATRTSTSISELLVGAGFSVQYRPGDETPPVSSWVYREQVGTPIEFLAPERRARKPSPPTLEIGGVSAQTLKGLELLLVAPWAVELNPSSQYPVASPLEVHVPNPIAFVLHKLLVSGARRERGKRDKDVLCAYDTVLLFADSDLSRWVPPVRAELSRGEVRRLGELATQFELSRPPDSAPGAAIIASRSERLAPPLASQIAGTLAAAIRRYLARAE